jgi:branched-chain amino acid transport system substrate-binding protein
MRVGGNTLRNRTKITALLMGLGLMLAACGTRLPNSAFTTQAASSNGQQGAGNGVDNSGSVADNSSTNDTIAAGDQSSSGGSSPSNTGGGTNTSPGSSGAASGPNQASDVGITATTITLGNITAENGVLGDAFAPAVRGMRAWVAATNAKGGIGGRQIILKTCDDREDRARDLACAQQLVEQDKVFALVGDNTRAHGGSAQYLNDHAVPTIGFPITNSFIRYPHFWDMYPEGYVRDGVHAGYNGQIIQQTGPYRWFKQNLNVTKAAVFEYDIDASTQEGNAIVKGLRLEGFSATPYVVSFAAPSFDQAVADMQNDGTQIVFDTMDDGANRKLCDAMQRRSFKVTAKVSTVVSMGDNVGTDYNDTCRNSVYIVGDTLPYSMKSNPEVAAFRAGFAKYQAGYPLHQWALESWSVADLIAQYIKQMGASPTRVGLEKLLTNTHAYTAGGVYDGLQWTPQDYSTPKAESCFGVARWQDSAGGWIEATNKFPFCYEDAIQYGTATADQGN